MALRSFGRAVVSLLFLLCSPAAGAQTDFEIRNGALFHDGARFSLRGVVYSNTPIGREGATSLESSGCLYARDFPLIAAVGANAIRTVARVSPDDRAFRVALEDNQLYWLAGFPLDDYYAPLATLSRDAPEGLALRERILLDFSAYASALVHEPRLIGFAFGDQVGRDYQKKFAGSAADFYTLLDEAASRLDEVGSTALLTTVVDGAQDVGSFALRANDPNQPGLDFWSLDAAGLRPLGPLIQAARARTIKPFLFAGFGVDAYDAVSGSEDADFQAETARLLTAEIRSAGSSEIIPLLGGFYASFVDEWHLGGSGPQLHGVAGEVSEGSADGVFNPAWSGLFGAVRTGSLGLDSLRPRAAYFELAAAWQGEAPPEISLVGPPGIEFDGARNAASGLGFLAQGGLLSIHGDGFSASAREAPNPGRLPINLGPTSACISSRPIPLLMTSETEIRGQVPWRAETGATDVVVFRAGVASNVSSAEVRTAAPGIFSRGVFRAGLPCPVDEMNGVRPGEYLEIYGTGLGATAAGVVAGAALSEPSATVETPLARLGALPLDVLYAGLFPGAVGVYQTNVRVPVEATPGLNELRLLQGGIFSNPRPVPIISSQEQPFFNLADPQPSGIVVQEGGPPQSALVEIRGGNSFCSLVRFEIAGLPTGVRASIPVGFPGQVLTLKIWAEPGAARVDQAPIRLRGVSSSPDRPERTLRVTVLPGSGDISFRVISGGWLSGVPVARFEMEDRVLFETFGGGPGRGFNFLTVDPRSGALGPVRSFDTWGSDEDVEAMELWLESLVEGELVLGAIADDGVLKLTDRARELLVAKLGSQLADFLEYQYSWAVITRVGAERPIAERMMPNGIALVERVLSFPLEAPTQASTE